MVAPCFNEKRLYTTMGERFEKGNKLNGSLVVDLQYQSELLRAPFTTDQNFLTSTRSNVPVFDLHVEEIDHPLGPLYQVLTNLFSVHARERTRRSTHESKHIRFHHAF